MVLASHGLSDSVGEFRDEMDRLLSGFFGNFNEGWPPGRGRPAINIWHNDEAVFVELEVPGLSHDQVDVAVVNNELTIKVHRPETQEGTEAEKVTYHRQERPTGESVRVVRLPVDVDSDKVSAELENGVLEIKLPKSEKVKPHKIAVKSAD